MAKHAIKKGEEIFDCYGQHHLSHGKVDRQKIISAAFMFDCQCKVSDREGLCRDYYPSLSVLR